jgi:protein-disulfide isomerase
LVFRHFPVTSKHPRSAALHAAAEAVGRQGRFFEFVDSLYADRAHVDDPHLWERVEALALDLGRFEADRRSPEVAARVRRDFESGIRAGVTVTPAFF